MTRSDCVRSLLAEYQARRAQDEQEQAERIAEAERLDMQIARLREESRDLAFDGVRQLLSQSTQEERRACAERMRQRGQFNNAEIRRRLRALGLPEDYLSPHYRCPVCRDTGYVGDAPARFCDCFEAELRRRLHEDGSMAGVDEQCFERFDPNVFPEADGQRAKMLSVRRACEDYADSFPNTRHLNLVLTGSGGLGKTFLLNCIYARVSERGFPAARVSAFRMFETMRRTHFANSNEEQGFAELIAAPLLLIDDLGTEPMMRNITVEYLFTLLNERRTARRHTVIATNLSPLQIKECYGERVASRILDRSLSATMRFTGRDIRLL